MSHLLSFVVKSTRVAWLYPGASFGAAWGVQLFGAPHTPGFCTWVQLLGGSTFNQSAEGVSTLLYPVSLLFGCWDRVQGGDPLYAPVKCKLVQNGHSSPQQWSEQFTGAYMGSPPPTRWSIFHLFGQLSVALPMGWGWRQRMSFQEEGLWFIHIAIWLWEGWHCSISPKRNHLATLWWSSWWG